MLRTVINTACVVRRVLLLLLTCAFALALAKPSLEAELSPAEQAIAQQQIDKVKSPADRKVIGEWSNAKLVVEFICRPAALQVLKKQDATVDKVFLGTDNPSTLILESASRLTGTGQYRYSQGWQDITFACDINPETGKVTSFKSVAAKNGNAH